MAIAIVAAFGLAAVASLATVTPVLAQENMTADNMTSAENMTADNMTRAENIIDWSTAWGG